MDLHMVIKQLKNYPGVIILTSPKECPQSTEKKKRKGKMLFN